MVTRVENAANGRNQQHQCGKDGPVGPPELCGGKMGEAGMPRPRSRWRRAGTCRRRKSRTPMGRTAPSPTRDFKHEIQTKKGGHRPDQIASGDEFVAGLHATELGIPVGDLAERAFFILTPIVIDVFSITLEILCCPGASGSDPSVNFAHGWPPACEGGQRADYQTSPARRGASRLMSMGSGRTPFRRHGFDRTGWRQYRCQPRQA